MLFLFMTSCTNPLGSGASRVSPDYGGGVKKLPAVTGFEVVAGSGVSTLSSSGHHLMDVAAGVPTTQLKLKSTGNKIVYISVQGQIISK